MTRQTFYRALAKCKDKFIWKLSEGHFIRAYLKGENQNKTYGFCPINAVAYTKGICSDSQIDRVNWWQYDEKLGLSKGDGGLIAESADSKGYDSREKLCRKALLRAVNLQENIKGAKQ